MSPGVRLARACAQSQRARLEFDRFGAPLRLTSSSTADGRPRTAAEHRYRVSHDSLTCYSIVSYRIV